jgi:hypothetical protein
MSCANLEADCATPGQRGEAGVVHLARVRLPGDAVDLVRSPSSPRPGGSAAPPCSPSPSKRSRKEAWVPVVPRTPRKRSVSSRNSISSRSSSRSWIQSVARLPTVVGCAGWKWVKPERREVAVLAREVRERGDHADQPPADQPQRLAVLDQVGVVADVGAGRAEVDDPRASGACSPRWWTCAMTSCRSSRSSSPRAPGPRRPGARGAPRSPRPGSPAPARAPPRPAPARAAATCRT